MTSVVNQNIAIHCDEEPVQEKKYKSVITGRYKNLSGLLSLNDSQPKEIFKLPDIDLHSELSEDFDRQALELTELIEKNPLNEKVTALNMKIEKLENKIDKIEGALGLVVKFIQENFSESDHTTSIEKRIIGLDEKIETRIQCLEEETEIRNKGADERTDTQIKRLEEKINLRVKDAEENIDIYAKNVEERFEDVEQGVKKYIVGYKCDGCKEEGLKYICSKNALNAQNNPITVEYYKCVLCGHVATLQK